jgi:hypothetical protein
MRGYSNIDLYYKMNLLRKHAKLLFTTEHFNFTVNLFTWDRFFIEQYFDHDYEQISRISIANAEDMVKHLEQIDVSDLGPRFIL